MADVELPHPKSSEVLSGVIEKLIPPRAYTYLFATLPGLFFEISILVANPRRICKLVIKAQDGFGLNHYELLGLALILAFIIGNAFMLLVSFNQLLLSKLYRRSLKPEEREIPENDRKCWAVIARQLLTAKYGMEPQGLSQEDWNVLYESLGMASREEVGASTLVMASEAMGWCGFAGMLFAHTLANPYYVIFCLCLVAAGLLHGWHAVRLVENPHSYGLVRVRVLLRELGDFAKKEA
jgi:hypothetical protein